MKIIDEQTGQEWEVKEEKSPCRPGKPLDPYLFRNHLVKGSSIDLGEKESPDALFNAKDPTVGLLQEKPEHRIIILLKLEGKSNKEIAQLTGYSPLWVGNVLRQPWAKTRIVEELKIAGRDGIANLLSMSAEDSVMKIIDLRDTARDESIQLRAAQDLLDRHLGKATQKVESTSVNFTPSADIEALDAEIKRLESQEAQLLGVPARN